MANPVMKNCPWERVGENTSPDGVYVCLDCGRITQGKSQKDLLESSPARFVEMDTWFCPDFGYVP